MLRIVLCVVLFVAGVAWIGWMVYDNFKNGKPSEAYWQAQLSPEYRTKKRFEKLEAEIEELRRQQEAE